MDRLIALAHRLARVGAWFGGALLICAAFIICVEIVIRKLFNASIGGADELSTFALAIGSAWAFGFTMLERAHVRIESLYVTLPTRLCAVVDLVAHTVFTAIVAVIAWHGMLVFKASAEMGARTLSPLATPVAIPQFLWAAGLAFFLFVAVLLLIRASVALVTGDVGTVQRLIGPRSVSREIDSELEQIEQLRQRDREDSA